MTTEPGESAQGLASSGDPRLFAVIPAAGHSRRMGRPKLLLPVGNETVISRLLKALQHPDIAARLVIVRQSDESLQAAIDPALADVVSPPIDPPDMRASVELGLSIIGDRFHPHPTDGWLMVPADHPLLEPRTIAHLVAIWLRERPRFLIPTYAGKGGHPLIARWDTWPLVRQLPPDQGLNSLLHRHAAEVLAVPVEHEGVVADLDIPQEYERWLRVYG